MKAPEVEVVETDLLILGGGMAGCGAAYEAGYWGRAKGLRTTIVEKAAVERSGAVAMGLSAINCYMGMRWGENQLEDFVRYDMRFDENIGVGEIESVRDALERNNGVPESIQIAATNSLAASLLPKFEKGYQQMLGRRFEEGVELSGGEWQKIALARAYLRDAQVLILDEPTAALDARAEYEVFLRFAELVAGRMAILISHRFSTVRMADRIIVLKKGSVVEQGSHEELLATPGLYEELFRMQATGYR